MSIKAIGHIGFCVSDLDRSLRFWREALGFEVLREHEFYGSSWRRILEIEGPVMKLQTRIMRRDHVTLELLCFQEPGHRGDGERQPMNQLGFTQDRKSVV